MKLYKFVCLNTREIRSEGDEDDDGGWGTAVHSAPSATAVARSTNWLAPLVAIWVTDKISNQRRPRT